MNEYPSVSPTMNLPQVVDFLRKITRLRGDDVSEIKNLGTRFVKGRLRTDRVDPTSNSDVLATDQLGDIVRTATHEYVVVNDAGTLKWARSSLDVTW